MFFTSLSSGRFTWDGWLQRVRECARAPTSSKAAALLHFAACRPSANASSVEWKQLRRLPLLNERIGVFFHIISNKVSVSCKKFRLSENTSKCNKNAQKCFRFSSNSKKKVKRRLCCGLSVVFSNFCIKIRFRANSGDSQRLSFRQKVR